MIKKEKNSKMYKRYDLKNISGQNEKKGGEMAFTDLEKENIRKRLLENCEKHWSKYGYRKTKVEELCIESGISKGAFYKFYNSKEELFLDVMLVVQSRFVNMIQSQLHSEITKEEFANLLKKVYKEFVKIPFILETQSPDFIAFINKLPNEKMNELSFHDSYDLDEIIQQTNLKYKVDKTLALSSLGIMFTPLSDEQQKLFNQVGTIEFLIELIVKNVLY